VDSVLNTYKTQYLMVFKQLFLGNYIPYVKKVKVKVKVTLEQATKVQRWSRGIVLLFI
jgi:hypothetical protein